MKIQIQHLKDGTYEITDIIKAGTLHFYEEDYYHSDIEVIVTLNKFRQNITVHATVKTIGDYTCDRCLSPYQYHFEDSFDMVYYMGEKELETDEDDVEILPPDAAEIDLSERIVESLILGTPVKKLCKEDCKGICPHCGVDLNKGKCKCPDTPIDPRWDKLRKLLK